MIDLLFTCVGEGACGGEAGAGGDRSAACGKASGLGAACGEAGCERIKAGAGGGRRDGSGCCNMYIRYIYYIYILKYIYIYMFISPIDI